MLHLKKYLIIFSLVLLIPNLFAETADDLDTDLNGTVWELVKNGSNNSSFGNGQVVYFLSSDAYQTYRSRKFQTWDTFSIVDGRNLVRLKKNDDIQIVESKMNNSIYEVKLLNGFYKGKTYYLIADELEKNFKQEIQGDENA
jgi:hypothetical protein